MRNVDKRVALRYEREQQKKQTTAALEMPEGEAAIEKHARTLIDCDDCFLFIVESRVAKPMPQTHLKPASLSNPPSTRYPLRPVPFTFVSQFARLTGA